jgi:hypothetical protein
MDEVELHAALIRPLLERFRGELGAVPPGMREVGQPQGPAHLHAVPLQNPLGQRTTARWPQSFFWTTSPRMCLSSVSSATRRFKRAILIAQLAELADLGEPELRVLLLPQLKTRLAHAELSTYVGHRGAAFRLAQRKGNLLVGKSLPLHGPLLPFRRTSEVSLVQF